MEKGRRHATCGLAIKPDTPLRFPLELLLQVAGKGAASLGGKGDTVAGKLKLGCGEQALAWAGDISELVVVVVTTEAAELVLQQVGAFKLDPLAMKVCLSLMGTSMGLPLTLTMTCSPSGFMVISVLPMKTLTSFLVSGV